MGKAGLAQIIKNTCNAYVLWFNISNTAIQIWKAQLSIIFEIEYKLNILNRSTTLGNLRLF